MCQVSGFGFKRVDAIVRKGDLPLNSPMRIHGAVFAALDTGRNEKGHLFLEEDALAKTGVKLLNEIITDGQVKVTPEEVDAVVQDMILKGEIVSSNGNIYQSNVFVQEDETAGKLRKCWLYRRSRWIYPNTRICPQKPRSCPFTKAKRGGVYGFSQ